MQTHIQQRQESSLESKRASSPGPGKVESERSRTSLTVCLPHKQEMKKSPSGLEKPGLKDSTKVLMTAEQPALSARAIEAEILHNVHDPRCSGDCGWHNFYFLINL